LRPFFIMEYRQDLHDIIEPAVQSVGYELFACEYVSAGENSVLRVYIDQPEGIGLEDCERASHQVSAVLDVDDPIKGHYHLEVSSPGIDRALLRRANFDRYIDQKVKIKLIAPIEKQRFFMGILKSVQEVGITVGLEAQDLVIPFSHLSKANLVEDLSKIKPRQSKGEL
jgi:ribosome maturation factor RimP